MMHQKFVSMPVIAGFCLFVFACSAGAPAPLLTTFTSVKHPDKSGWRIGELIYHEPFDTLDDWRPEARVDVSVQDGHMLIACGEANEDRGNVWSVREFDTPYYFEFRYKKLSGRQGLCLIFWNARTIDGADFFSIPREWDMPNVIDGNMNSYHISYSRGGSGITNFHKNPNFHDLTLDVPDPLAEPGEEWHTIGVYQQGSHIMFYEDGQLVHDIDETVDFEHMICLRTGKHQKWEVENAWGTMCPGLDARKVYRDDGEAVCRTGRRYTFEIPEPGKPYVYTSGRIGFRHQNGVTMYDDLRVWKLEPPK